MNLKFLHVFLHGLITHFFLALKKISLSDCTTVYLSVHLLKDILIVSELCQLKIKLLEATVCGFLCGHKFSALLGKYQGVQSLNYLERVSLVL